jgi:hypothetical protein
MSAPSGGQRRVGATVLAGAGQDVSAAPQRGQAVQVEPMKPTLKAPGT